MVTVRFVRSGRKAGKLPVTGIASSKPAKPRKKVGVCAPSWKATPEFLEVTVPLRLKSLNKQENGFARWRRVKAEHGAIQPLLNVAMRGGKWFTLGNPEDVTITRLGPRLFDRDNNAAACKAVQDCVARWLGVDDDPMSATQFETTQEVSPTYGVRIRIEAKKAA